MADNAYTTKPLSYWMCYPGDSGCTFHRMLLPAHFCAEEMAERGVTLLCGQGLPPGHDVYAMHGLPDPAAAYELVKIRRRGKTVVWSVDDDWLTLPDWNPVKPGEEGMATYEILARVAHHVVCSTEALAKTFRARTDRDPATVHVAPNLLDLSRFPTPPSETDADGRRFITLTPKTPVRVAWVGSHTHARDVEELVEPLSAFCAKFLPERRAEVVFMGMAPPARLLTKWLHRGLYHQPTTHLAGYQSVLNSIEPHVYLAPLDRCDFNRSKSNLRVIEGWALCAAPVATDFGEYASIRNGVDGRLVSTADQWSSALNRLVADHETRVQMAANGRARVEARYNWASPECRRPWVETFSKICGVQP